MSVLQPLARDDRLDLGTRLCTLAKFRAYTGRRGPNHHTDEAEAAKVGLDRPLAPGAMLVAYIYEALTNVYGVYWLAGGVLSVAFTAPVWPGDRVGMQATVTELIDGVLVLAVELTTHDGRVVLAGTARGRYAA